MLTTTRKKPNSRKRKNEGEKWKSTVKLGLGFPAKASMTHKYHETVWMASTAGVITFYKFTCNGMYDPNVTGTGHQPYYFDQMNAVYNHYTVVRSRIRVNVCGGGYASTANSYLVSLSLNDDATQNANTMDSTVEQSTGTIRLVPQNASDLVVHLSSSWSATKVFGGDPLSNDNLQGSSSSNPTELTLFVIAMQPCDTVSSQVIYMEVTIEYDAIWDEVKDLPSS